jgi:hypothetical protein
MGESATPRGRYEHHVTGVIHEITPRTGTAEAIEEALAHERDDCGAHSVVVDLRHVGGSLGDDGIAVIVQHVEPDIHRWAVRLPEGSDPWLAVRLADAGLGSVLIAGEGEAGPRTADPVR